MNKFTDYGEPSEKLIKAHEREIVRLKASAHNFGWGVSKTEISSKTDKGVIITTMSGHKITHHLTK